ncbi:MAG: dihydropyrimidinase [Cellulosilyticaceae bacterium]
MSILIKGALLATQNIHTPQDILIEKGIIKQIGQLEVKADEVIDAKGYIAFPGFIDAHTHLDMDTGTALTADDFRSGTLAAVAGGTTTIIDFATQNKGETLVEALKNWHQKAGGKCYCDYGFHMAITDWNEAVQEEIALMKSLGVTSFKLYMAYDALRVRDGEIYQILKAVKQIEGIIGVHCENGDLVNELIKEQLAKGHTAPGAHPLARPDTVEAEAIGRFLDIAYLAGTPAHIVHLSTLKGLEQIRRARARGQKVFVETCPQYLTLDEQCYEQEGFESAKYVLSPPLRKKEDREALWEALGNGEIQTISTDHCAFNFKGQKEQGLEDFSKIPNGIPGIQHRPQLIYTYGVCEGEISLKQMADLLSTQAAKLFGMYPKKGALQIGSDADLVLWNPEMSGEITADQQLHNVDYTPYEGIAIRGRAEYVFLKGQQVVTEGQVEENPLGSYVYRKGIL